MFGQKKKKEEFKVRPLLFWSLESQSAYYNFYFGRKDVNVSFNLQKASVATYNNRMAGIE
jgi:hypothetical protein